MEELYKVLAIEFNLPYEVIRRVCRSPFKTMLRALQSDELKQVRIQGLGLFWPAVKRRKEKEENPKSKRGHEQIVTLTSL